MQWEVFQEYFLLSSNGRIIRPVLTEGSSCSHLHFLRLLSGPGTDWCRVYKACAAGSVPDGTVCNLVPGAQRTGDKLPTVLLSRSFWHPSSCYYYYFAHSSLKRPPGFTGLAFRHHTLMRIACIFLLLAYGK